MGFESASPFVTPPPHWCHTFTIQASSSLNYKASRSPVKRPSPYLVHHSVQWWAFENVSVSGGVERNSILFHKHSQKILSCSRGVTFLYSSEQSVLNLCLKCPSAFLVKRETSCFPPQTREYKSGRMRGSEMVCWPQSRKRGTASHYCG